jgi:hypothetical protein
MKKRLHPPFFCFTGKKDITFVKQRLGIETENHSSLKFEGLSLVQYI